MVLGFVQRMLPSTLVRAAFNDVFHNQSQTSHQRLQAPTSFLQLSAKHLHGQMQQGPRSWNVLFLQCLSDKHAPEDFIGKLPKAVLPCIAVGGRTRKERDSAFSSSGMTF